MSLDDSKMLDLYRVMVRIRAFENGVRSLMADDRIGRVSFSTGGEAVAACVCAHLADGDQIGSTHRPLGHLVAKGSSMKKTMAEIAGRKTGHNRGKGGPYHVFDRSVGALGANGIVGGSVPMSAGYALAHQVRGSGGVSVSFFGEGASNQGGVQETLNLAACWNLPMVFVCENSSPEVQRMLGHEIDYPQLSVDDVSIRAQGYGIPGSTHSGWDAEQVYKVTEEAVRRARGGEGPTLLEFKIHRISPDEDTPYCPVRLTRQRLLEQGVLTVGLDAEMWREAEAEVAEAVIYALESPEPELLEAYSDVFKEERR